MSPFAQHPRWTRPWLCAALGALALGHCGLSQAQIKSERLSLWPHWEGRVGVVLDGAVEPIRNPFALGQSSGTGLKLQSLHVLSDYYVTGGFRATMGLIHGSTSQPFPAIGGQGGLSVQAQRLDNEGIAAYPPTEETTKTVPYVGAGYSGRITEASGYGAWRFNADLGLISLNSQNIGRISRVLQGDQGVDELIRELRLRPVIKFSVNYAF